MSLNSYISLAEGHELKQTGHREKGTLLQLVATIVPFQICQNDLQKRFLAAQEGSLYCGLCMAKDKKLNVTYGRIGRLNKQYKYRAANKHNGQCATGELLKVNSDRELSGR